MPDTDTNPLHRLTEEQLEDIGKEFEDIGQNVRLDLGESDARYIRSIIAFHRRLAALSRVVLVVGSRYKPA